MLVNYLKITLNENQLTDEIRLFSIMEKKILHKLEPNLISHKSKKIDEIIKCKIIRLFRKYMRQYILRSQ
jgi:hypothetical protein